VHESLARKLRNSLLFPALHVAANRLYALRPTSNHVDDVLAELMRVGPADVDRFASGLLGSVHVECFCHGNLSQEQALSLGKGVRALLARGPGLRAPDLPRHRVVALEAGSAYLHRCGVRNPEEVNSALENYYQLGLDTAEQRAMLMLLAQVASEPCFDILRTKEQLGYHVHCGYRLTNGVLGFCVQVVSDKYDPVHLDERVEAFLGSLLDLLTEMTGPEFQEHREAVLEGRLQQDQSLYDESDRLWHTIWNHGRDFAAREVQARALKEISLTDLRGFYAGFLDPAQPARRKMSLQVFGCNSDGPEGRPAEVAGAHTRVMHFEAPTSVHSALPLFPLPS
jgi:nardilysin